MTIPLTDPGFQGCGGDGGILPACAADVAAPAGFGVFLSEIVQQEGLAARILLLDVFLHRGDPFVEFLLEHLVSRRLHVEVAGAVRSHYAAPAGYRLQQKIRHPLPSARRDKNPSAGHVRAGGRNLACELDEVDDALLLGQPPGLGERRAAANAQSPSPGPAQRLLRKRNRLHEDVLTLLEVEPRYADEGELVRLVAEADSRPCKFLRVDRVRLDNDGKALPIKTPDGLGISLRKRDNPVASTV